MSDGVSATVIRLIDYLLDKQQVELDSVRLALLEKLQGEMIESVFSWYRYGPTYTIQVAEALDALYPKLTENDRAVIALWAGTRLDLEKIIIADRTRAKDEAELRRAIFVELLRAILKPPVNHKPTNINNELRTKTPLGRLYHWINDKNVNWQTDDRHAIKAYVMACFSELAYLHLADQEVQARGRYKRFEPSLVRSELLAREIRLDLVQALTAADMGAEIIEAGRFVYLVAKTAAFVVIAVRGTDFHSLKDWLIDFDAAKNQAAHGFYHRGFDDEARIALPLLVNSVGDRTPIYITGHSLGAAVASILTQIWPVAGNIRKPYLYAPPRFGTRSAAKRLPRYAYVRPLDIVPHLPPRLLGFSDEGADFAVIPSGKQKSGWRSLWHILSRRSFEQHNIEQHRRIIGEALEEEFPDTVYIDVIIDNIKGDQAV